MKHKAKSKKEDNRCLQLYKDNRIWLKENLLGMIAEIDENKQPDSFYSRRLAVFAYEVDSSTAMHQIKVHHDFSNKVVDCD